MNCLQVCEEQLMKLPTVRSFFAMVYFVMDNTHKIGDADAILRKLLRKIVPRIKEIAVYNYPFY